MEYITSSSGVKYVLSQCNHQAVIVPYRSLDFSANQNSTFPSLTGSYHHIPRNKALTYGKSSLFPNDKIITRSSSALAGPTVISKPIKRTSSMQYDPINDPHLRDYFERKFKLSSAKKRKFKEKKPGPNELYYRVKVKTGNCTNASTDANVYLTIRGTRGDVNKKLLFNQYKAIKTENGYKFKFERNSENVFKLIGVDVGQINSIVVEHDGQDVHSSWFLKEILITNTKTNRSWLFEYNDWLSLDHGLKTTRIQLFPTRQIEKYIRTDYKIIVITGDKSGAGTDANVSITLFGSHNKSTQKFPLKSHDINLFERGKTDIFRLKDVNYVGPIKKVRIEHDNTGKSPGWFLERIVIIDLKDPKVSYYCLCSKWLDKNTDDGLISRDLIATEDPLDIKKTNKYRITVYTGDKRMAGTDADVSIVLYGTVGDSGEWKLDNKENNFERGKKDEFQIECPSVGEIKKIRIGHNGANPSSGWYLDKVIVDDENMGRVYEFLCDRWLAEDEEDGKTTVFLYPSADDSSQGIPYNLSIHTGDKKHADTDSQVYIELFGGRSGNKSSGLIKLKDCEFKRGKTVKTTVLIDKMLSPIYEVLVRHDNSGANPSWFLEGIDIETPQLGLKQFFPCMKWLAEDKEDGKIERILKEDTNRREERGEKVVWNLIIYTSDKKYAGTDSNVYLVLYGNKGKSDEIFPRENSENFEKGKKDKFRIETNDIGAPFKIRIGHDNSGRAPGWHLDRVELENLETKEKYFFNCNRWLDKKEEDGQIVRELPAEGDSIEKPLPIVNYIVEVYTGNKTNAGTDADVFINLFGELGDTGDRPLDSKKNNFERKKCDVFKIEAVKLKKLKKIRIGHNGKNPGAGWFLDKVVVRQENNPKYDEEFECHRWLAVDEDDGQLIRELFASTSSQFLDKTSYKVKVKTGDIRNAGTDARVTLKIFGDKGDTGDRALKSSFNTSNKFERGRLDEFIIEADDIGKIEKIQIGQNGKGPASGWFLDYVEIDVPSKGLRYKFSAHRWLDENEGDGQTEIELYPSEMKKMRKYIPYVIKTKTGNKRGAGTDADIFVELYGIDGKSEQIKLDNKTDNFEKGSEDVFKIEAEDVGPLYKVRIGHDNRGSNPGWFLEKMVIQRHAPRGSKRLKLSARRSSVVSQEDGELENYYFYVDKWFAKDEDDGQIVRELIPTDQDGRILIELDEVPYEVKVYTGDKRGAGTDSNVFLIIYGENGDSGERELRKSDKSNKFEQNQVDTFKVKAVELGELFKIRIWHDNKGIGAAWYLEKVEIYNPITDKMYLFNCQNWLSKDDGDGKIMRELPAIDPNQLKKVKFRSGVDSLKDQFLLESEAITTTYNVTVVTSDIRNAGTDAKVFIQLFGEKSDSGRIPLETPKIKRDPFERGHEDTFEIKEADVGDLRKIKIGHDGRGAGSGWHLKEVIIDAPKLGKRWKFSCGRWLDKFEEDGKTEVELYPNDVAYEEYNPMIPYEISVFTSNISGASTSANPYIVLYGTDIHTQKVDLCKNKSERSGKFKRGACDRFVLEMDDIGREITKIRLGHDNKGQNSSWHVDKVEIRRLKEGKKGSKIFVFPCEKWLARDKDDGDIQRDLVPSKIIDEKYEDGELRVKEKEVRDNLEMKEYQVEVFTGDVFKAGTDANVYLTLFGEFGDSGEKELLKSNHRNKFERKQTDRFIIRTADLGPLFKCQIRHDGSGISSDWFLDRIEVTEGRHKYSFVCERWLSKSRDDKKIERIIYEKNYNGPRVTSTSSLSIKSNIGGSKIAGSDPRLSIRQQSPFGQYHDGPTIPFKITIRTGDERNCGLSSQAFIRLFGQGRKQRTEPIKLQLAKKSRFEPGSSETFQIEALDIGELTQIEIGHEGAGPNESWFIKYIEISEPIKGRSYFITCNSWLSTEKGDGLTTRRFNIDETNTKISSFRGLIPYTLTIYTGDVPKAGTDSDVTLKFFGSKGNSGDIVIEKIDNRFDRAGIDTVNIDLDDIGSLKKVRVSHDAKGSRKEWYLDRLEMTNAKTKKQYVFVAEEWLSKKRADSRGLSIDIPVYKNNEQTIGMTDYKISVKTSDISSAGTDANVFITLFGENGDTGELELKKTKAFSNLFERGKTDVFDFKNVLSVGEITKLRIWHDNSGNIFGNTHWHLDSVLVEDLSMRKVYKFECKKWLSKSKEDKQLVRELTPILDARDQESPGNKTTYELSIKTADEPDAGTKHNIEIVLIGDYGETKPKIFENNTENKILRRGHLDILTFKTRSVGELQEILLSHVENYSKPESQWICDYVKVKDLNTGTVYKFPVMSILKLNKRPKAFRCETKKESQVSLTRGLKNVDYEILVVTGSEKGAGTNATASIIIYGKNGDSGKRVLKKGFDRSEKQVFNIECLDLGEINKVHIEHDNSSFKKDWFLERIEVKDKSTGKNYIFPCNKWLSKHKEDGEIERDLYPQLEEDKRSGSRLSSRSPRREQIAFDDNYRSSPRRKKDSYDDRSVNSDKKKFDFDEVPVGSGRRKFDFDEMPIRGSKNMSRYEDDRSSRISKIDDDLNRPSSSRRHRSLYDFDDYSTRSPRPNRRS